MYSYRTAMLIAALLLMSLSPSARADSGADAGTNDDLEQTVVTATRTAQPLAKTGSSVAVISGADLTTRQLLVVSDALAQTVGVTVTRSGGPGQDTSLFVRGAAPGETLVLVDGIRINDPSTTDGQAVLGDLLVNNIQRIEVLRGPQSTLYGSDAIGGVVNIITQRGGTQPFTGQLEAQGGSFGTQRFNGAANGTDGALEYGTAVNYYDTHGISAAAASGIDTDPDSDRNLGATANLRLHASDQISIDLRGFYTQSRADIPGYPPPTYALQASPEFLRANLLAGYAAVTGSWLDGRITQRLAWVSSGSDRRYYGVYDPISYAYSPAQNSYARGDANRWEYQGLFEVSSSNEFTYGAESRLDTLTTDTLPDPTATPTTGRDRLSDYYGQWQSTVLQQLTLTAGVRHDDDQQFGGHSSLKLAGAWQLADGATVLRANYGDGFKAPTLYQQFSAYSNPLAALQPQTAVGWEAGIDHTLLDHRLRASLTYFSRNEDHEIDFDDCSGSGDAGCARRPYGYYFNVGRSRAHGMEAELMARPVQSVSTWLNYTNMRATDELTGLALARRPHIAANTGIAWAAHTGASLGASYSFVGARFDDAANTVPLAAAQTVSVFGTYPLSASVQVLARVENLFDNQSEPAAGYRALGRAVYAGLRATL